MAIVSEDHLFPNGCDWHLNGSPHFVRLSIRYMLRYGNRGPGESDINQGLHTLFDRLGIHQLVSQDRSEVTASAPRFDFQRLVGLSQSLHTLDYHD